MDARVLATELMDEGMGELVMAIRDGAVGPEDAEDHLRLHLGQMAELWLLARPGDARADLVVNQLLDYLHSYGG